MLCGKCGETIVIYEHSKGWCSQCNYITQLAKLSNHDGSCRGTTFNDLKHIRKETLKYKKLRKKEYKKDMAYTKKHLKDLKRVSKKNLGNGEKEYKGGK